MLNMAETNFNDKQNLNFDEQIRRAMGLPRRSVQTAGERFATTNMEIPGPPNQQEVERIKGIRRDVARDMLGNLSGDETPDFLTKLNKHAGFESANADAPANSQIPFTPPLAQREPENLSALAEMLNETEARDEMMVTASRSDAIDPSLGPAAEIAAQLQPLSMPPPDFNPTVLPEVFADSGGVNRFQAMHGGLETSPYDFDGIEPDFSGAGAGQNRFQQMHGGLVTNPDAFSNTAARLASLNEDIASERLAAEQGPDGAEAAGEELAAMLNRGTHRLVQGSIGVAEDVGEGVMNALGPIVDFAGGFFGMHGESSGNPVNAATLVDAPPIPGEGSTSDAMKTKENDSAAGTDTGKTPPVSGVDARSDTPGAEGGEGGVDLINDGGGSKGISSFGVGRFSVHQGDTADRILGLALPPRDERGPGVEVIRGMRRSFQPTDESGRAVGGEIPFGRGTFQRLRNLGVTADEAIEFAIKMDEANSAAVRAGAEALLATVNAMSPIQHDFNGDGTKTSGFIRIDKDGNVWRIDSGTTLSLSETLRIVRRPVLMTGPTGLQTAVQSDFLVKIIDTDEGPVEIPFGTLNTRADAALVERHHAEYMDIRDALEADGIAGAHEKAIEMLRESVGQADR